MLKTVNPQRRIIKDEIGCQKYGCRHTVFLEYGKSIFVVVAIAVVERYGKCARRKLPRIEPHHGLVKRQYRVMPCKVGYLPLERLWSDEFAAIIEKTFYGRANAMIEHDLETSLREEARERGESAQSPKTINEPLHSGHSTQCSVLVIGTEAGLFRQGSAARTRTIHYGSCFSRLDLIVFTRGRVHTPAMLASGVHAYPTSSSSRFLYIADALRLAKKLPKPDVVSAQDP